MRRVTKRSADGALLAVMVKMTASPFFTTAWEEAMVSVGVSPEPPSVCACDTKAKHRLSSAARANPMPGRPMPGMTRLVTPRRIAA